jgi:NAD(P)-dependent dehydrogenase (short-subunit alcohol dehydrogenase family)
MDLTGKRILVTGASSGIGKATALLLSKLGAKVVLSARNMERLQSTLDSLDGDGHGLYVFDLEAVDEIPPLVRKIAQEQGRLSGLFHSAGTGGIMTVNLLKGKYVEQVFASSVTATLLLVRGFCQKGVRANGGNSLVFMSSAAALCGVSGMSIYSASKAAINGAIRSLACELAPRGIRVNSLVAGGVRTGMHETLEKTLSDYEILQYEQKHPLGFGDPDDVAYAAAFLLSDTSKWITGTTLIVDGGYSCV